MSIADKLQDLVTAKEDMKTALIEKGVTPTGGLSTYADAVRSITDGVKLPVGTKFSYSTFTSAPFFDTSQYTDMKSMFDTCRSLTNVPQYNTSNVTDMSYMFANCTSLSVIPRFDTSNVTSMYGMFRRLEYAIGGTGVTIERIPLMDCGNVEIFQIFDNQSYSGIIYVDYIEGFKDLGKSITDDYIASANYKNVSFARCLTSAQSMVNVFNELYDLEENGRDLLTIHIHPSTRRDMTDEQIAIATRKGWCVIDNV